MPDGHRRGGKVVRNGRTHYRRGAAIAKPKKALVVLAVVVGIGVLAGGGPLIAHPAVLACLGGVVFGALVLRGPVKRSMKNRRERKALEHRAEQRRIVAANTKRATDKANQKEQARTARETARLNRYRSRREGDRRTFSRPDGGGYWARRRARRDARRAEWRKSTDNGRHEPHSSRPGDVAATARQKAIMDQMGIQYPDTITAPMATRSINQHRRQHGHGPLTRAQQGLPPLKAKERAA